MSASYLKLYGAPALTPAKSSKLLDRLRAAHPEMADQIRELAADWLYLIWSERALSGDEIARLGALLDARSPDGDCRPHQGWHLRWRRHDIFGHYQRLSR